MALAIPQSQTWSYYDYAISLLSIYKQNENICSYKSCTWAFIEALLVIALRQKQTKCVSSEE